KPKNYFPKREIAQETPSSLSCLAITISSLHHDADKSPMGLQWKMSTASEYKGKSRSLVRTSADYIAEIFLFAHVRMRTQDEFWIKQIEGDCHEPKGAW